MIAIKNKKGFTLIELLIVIVIIGVLALALLPTILEGPKKARDAADSANIERMITAYTKAVHIDNDTTLQNLMLGTVLAEDADTNLATVLSPFPADSKTDAYAPITANSYGTSIAYDKKDNDEDGDSAGAGGDESGKSNDQTDYNTTMLFFGQKEIAGNNNAICSELIKVPATFNKATAFTDVGAGFDCFAIEVSL